ncbi:MAG: XRE family transcriptional regulator [Luteimonas sp.]
MRPEVDNRCEAEVRRLDLRTLRPQAAVLGIPTAYVYAEDEQLAQLISAFKSKRERKR